MAIDDGDRTGPAQLEGEVAAESAERTVPSVSVDEYTWAEFMDEHGHGEEVDALYEGLVRSDGSRTVPSGSDWDRVSFDPERYLGYHPDSLPGRLTEAAGTAGRRWLEALRYMDPAFVPVTKGIYTWEHFKKEFYYTDEGRPPRDEEGRVVPFDPTEYLGFSPEDTPGVCSNGENVATKLAEVVEERTVNVREELDEDAFFSGPGGETTITNRYDLEKAVPLPKKSHFHEVDRYWVNKPYAFVVIFHSKKENEKKYYLVEPHLTPIEGELLEFLTGKLRTAIKYAGDDVVVRGSEEERRGVIDRETRRLLDRYDLATGESEAIGDRVREFFGSDEAGVVERLKRLVSGEEHPEGRVVVGAEPVRPEPALIDEDAETLSPTQIEKLLYRLKRDFIGYQRIDGIKHDINVEDISCDGYNSPVFVYHGEYEQVITNVFHGQETLDDFVVKLAQRSGKGISKRQPQVDATLPDGSRAQLTLGQEVSDHGTNYTIRQFKDVPFTPVDLICWHTFSLEEMAFLWLCIENNKSLIFAGGTASGKTTSLNAVSLFIPSKSKIVSIEDTREVELPQRNWIASVTRASFSEDDGGGVDEFDLLEAALRQRPEYIVMGEIRGEEGRTAFQVMSTGHTTYTTFHADSVGEVLKRFTTEPINVSKTMFTALDLVSIQTSTRVEGRKVRRNKTLTEINHYDAENDEINVKDVYQWQAETDEYLKTGESNTVEEICFDRGWSREELDDELFEREVVIAYLIENGLNEYRQVAATFQAFINDPETIMTLIANDVLEESLTDLREMESVLIDVDPEKEALVPRPDPDEKTRALAREILARAEEELFGEYEGKVPEGLASALDAIETSEDVVVGPGLDDGVAVPGLPEGAPSALDEGESSADPDEPDGIGSDEDTDTSTDRSEANERLGGDSEDGDGDTADDGAAFEFGGDEDGFEGARPAEEP
ncbi:type II/IV secretion system ATPase subunit [Natronorarus salvus]|uniref:type II/IV secretion system ATPase subunit n=1 Tax=Natronorarus salvus TaxID=3117733 RepID=UPI00390824EF